MPTDPQRSSPGGTHLIASEPQLFVSDMEVAIDFYTGKLGFTLRFAYGEPAFFAQVVRDNARINLRLARGPVFEAGFLQREKDPVQATMALDHAEPLFLEYEAAGVMFHQTLRTEPWGARTFMVRDPDGNIISFAGD
jgi:catechol 2,3-dioxygenase-like lactoylglutathione lyase family enzyme